MSPNRNDHRGTASARCAVTARAVASAILFLSVAPRLAADPPNVLLILVDDVGIEHLGFYGLQDPPGVYAITPTLTALVEQNQEVVTFTDAWSTPLCSSTRMWIQTGLYGFSTGVGELVNPSDSFQPDLDEENYFLADLLRADTYERAAAFGKWHIGDDSDIAPTLIGYDDFWVTYHKDFYDGDPSYFTFKYTESTDSSPFYHKVDVPIEAGKYLTRETANAFLAWLDDDPPEPWFAYVAFFASHHPWHCPPSSIYTEVECATPDSNLNKHHDMIFALDTELGRILDAVGEDALFIIAGDNGSQNAVAINPPVDPNKAKSTVAQGGVRVPLLIGGAGVDPDVLGNEVGDIVNLTDLYDTILEFGEAEGPERTAAEDLHSVSLRPYLADDTQLPEEPLRDCAYTEIFSPNGTFGGPLPPPVGSYSLYNVAVRGADYKYMKKYASGQQLLFQLENSGVEEDLWETDNLLTDPTSAELAEMSALLQCGDEFFGTCTLRKEEGEACTYDVECCSGDCGGASGCTE